MNDSFFFFFEAGIEQLCYLKLNLIFCYCVANAEFILNTV